jgi:tRNA(Ile)-lysidine synthase
VAEPVAERVPVAGDAWVAATGQLTGLTSDELICELLGHCTFPAPGEPVVCAVSGGADSLALLVLAVAAGCRVTAVHVDHGLRPGSGTEAEVVRAATTRFGAAFRSERVEVAPGPNLEARARAARVSRLPSGVLTGHTADDQAETMLLNLLRGSGLDGLAGMAVAGHPLLRLRRSETARLCKHLGLVPVHDPSNLDPMHLRNRVRHELLPLLDQLARRDVAGLLARQAGVLRADADLLDEMARAIDPTDARALSAAPVALARRAVRAWLADPHPPPAVAVARVLAVARGDALACQLPGGRRVSRHGGRLRVSGGPR